MPRQNSYKQTGIPIVTDTPTMGTSFYVGNSTNRTDSITATNNTQTHGFSPQRPFATVDFATNQCLAGRGDKVYILEGHAETISTTATWSPDVADVQYIGSGFGESRPVFTLASSAVFPASQIRMSAANVRISNVIFRGGQSSTGSSNIGVMLAANNTVVDHCKFDSPTSVLYIGGYSVAIGNTSGGAAGLNSPIIDNCIVVNNGTTDIQKAGILAMSTGSTGKWYQISNNTVMGTYSEAAIHSSSNNSIQHEMILDNFVYNSSTADSGLGTSGNGIMCGSTLMDADTGVIIGNRIASGSSATAANQVDYGAHHGADNIVVPSLSGLSTTFVLETS